MSIDLHSLIAPYALDALDADERSRFEAHLDQCPECQSELSGFVSTATRMGDAQSHQPPAELRDRLLATVSRTPQERPVVTALSQRSKMRRTLPRLAVAAAVLVALAGIGGYVTERQTVNDLQAQNSSITQVLAAEDATVTVKDFKGGGHVRMVAAESTDSAYIVARDLPALDDSKVYQVWMITGSSPTSQGYFVSDGDMLMHGVDGADRVAITVEPAGGSDQPTTAPIAAMAV